MGDILAKVEKGVEKNKDCLKEIKAEIFGMNKKVESHATTIKQRA